MKSSFRPAFPWLALLLVLMATSLAYAPGLSGGFLFDDFVNLDAIGATGPVDNWPTFWRFITSGTADPTGRPLALLSFLIDARDWPADPGPFLLTNLLLHLVNGTLLFVLLRRLGPALGDGAVTNDFGALLGAGMWVLHPLFVSTTLYVVQREAMLPTTCTLMGLCLYAAGRQQYVTSAGRSGLSTMWFGVGGFTVLAMLCKANGVLLPLLAGVLELTIWRRPGIAPGDVQANKRLRTTLGLLLVLPSLVLLLYLFLNLPGLQDPIAGRPWTISQRLLTEPRVLLEYVHLLIVPRSVSTGLYNDAFPVSFNLWSPATTLPALLTVSGLILFALRNRSQTPKLSAAILFFFAGHLLESSTIPLELFFEHRNYLPALLLFWPLASAIGAWRTSVAFRSFAAALLFLLLFATTRARAELWGNPAQLAASWSSQSPESSRAQAATGMALMRSGRFQEATQKLGELWTRRPADPQLALNYADAACRWRGISRRDVARLRAALSSAIEGQLLIYQWLGRAIDVAQGGQCIGMTLDDVAGWIEASAVNPQLSVPAARDETIEPLRARLAIARRQPKEASTHFNRALMAFTTPDVAASNASLLASSGYFEQALAHLDFYEQIKERTPKPSKGMPWVHAKVLNMQGYWPREMKILRANLKAEISTRSSPSGAHKGEGQ